VTCKKIYWSTNDEINFLSEIKKGRSFRGIGQRNTKERASWLLQKYFKSMNLRVIWGDIEKEKVREWLLKEGI